MRVSAGILLYRVDADSVRVLLAHPGGPLWTKRDDGAWSIPKGELDGAEEPLDAARREFSEESGHPAPDGAYIDLGEVRLRSGKLVRAWAVNGDLDPATAASSTFELEWPPRSGRRITVPEVDRFAWFRPEEAARKLNPAQVAFVERLVRHLAEAAGR
ncbi:MAG TPA: NUDIX domain-containing protein [Candidatus Limnocylindrales bacterium]|nr:NUDIX domain-containing protein [Candidatus Limnocylindrales bacterium]